MQKLAMRTRSRGAETTEENQAATLFGILARKYKITETHPIERQPSARETAWQEEAQARRQCELAQLSCFLVIERDSLKPTYLAGVQLDELRTTLKDFWMFPRLLELYAGASYTESRSRYAAVRKRLREVFQEIEATKKAELARQLQDQKIKTQSRLDAVYRCIAARASGATARQIANDTGICLRLVRNDIQTLRRDGRIKTSSFHAGKAFAEHIYVSSVF